MSLTSFAVQRPVTTLSIAAAVTLLGCFSIAEVPVSLLPNVDLPVATIRSTYPGAGALEASRFVAEPIEAAVASTPGVIDLRSISRNENVTTTVQFAWGTDMQRTLLTLRERLDNVRAVLPPSASRPTLLTSDPGARPIAVMAITSDLALATVARLARDVHVRRLEQIDGVSNVSVVGAPEEQIEVRLSPERLRSLNLTADAVTAALQESNITSAGGTVRRGQFRLNVRTLTEFTSLDDILGTAVGPRIRLRDIATARFAARDPLTVTRLNGRPAIGLVVYKDAGANTVSVTREIQRNITQLEREHPDIRVVLIAAQATFVTDALANLWQEVWLGAVLSILVPLAFLRDWRASIAIATVLPLSVLIAIVLVRPLHVTINVLSLGGLALGCGLLIDNAIVVADAALRREQELGDSRAVAVVRGAEEMALPLLAGTLTTILVFVPIMFVDGLAAALFRDLSWSVVMSVGGSFALALTVLPVLLATRRRRRRGTSALGRQYPSPPIAPQSRFDKIIGKWDRSYERGVTWALDNPRTTGLMTLVGAASAMAIGLATPREVLPRLDEGVLLANLRLPEGSSLEATVRQTSRVERIASLLGAEKIYARVGLATDAEVLAGAEPGSSATAQIIIPAFNGKSSDLAAALREGLTDLVSQGYLSLDETSQSELGAIAGREGRAIRIEVEAPTYAASAAAGEIIRQRLGQLPTLSDVRNPYANTQPIVEVGFERNRLVQYGIAPQVVARTMAAALGGVDATELRETDRRATVRVRYDDPSHEGLEAALATTIKGVPLRELVTVHNTRAPAEIVRVRQRPVTIVEALAERGGTAAAVSRIETALGTLQLPGVGIQITGADVEQRRVTSQLLSVAGLSAMLIFLVLAGEFASWRLPLVVMLTVPLAAAGGVVLLCLTHQSLNAVSLIGIVVMIGMADNEAVVKIDAILRHRAAGYAVRDAIVLGGRQRLRGITMTSLTTITGTLPLMFGLGGGGALYRPLAAAVVGGAVTTLVVTCFVIPVAYQFVDRPPVGSPQTWATDTVSSRASAECRPR